MIYYNERTWLSDELAEAMTTAAERLHAIADRLAHDNDA